MLHGLINDFYIRVIAAFLTAAALGIFSGGYLISWLRSRQKDGQPIRTDGPQSHVISKRGTPTMGGIIIIASILASVLLWCDLSSYQIRILLVTILFFSLLGFGDDYKKLTKNNSYAGLSGRFRILMECVFGLGLFGYLQYAGNIQGLTLLDMPFTKTSIDIGYAYPVLLMIMMCATSNSVNIPDGLDSLASLTMLPAVICFGLIATAGGIFSSVSAHDMRVLAGVGEISVFCAALGGALLGFIWFNSFPAKVFMGDMGSLMLGGVLGVLAVLTKKELLLIIIGGVFVFEAACDLIQIYYYKMTKKRVFLMAPIHHHFEKKGMHEVTIVLRFFIGSVVLGAVALMDI